VAINRHCKYNFGLIMIEQPANQATTFFSISNSHFYFQGYWEWSWGIEYYGTSFYNLNVDWKWSENNPDIWFESN